MAVTPDLLLKTPTVDVRPKASAKAPDTPRESRDGGAASFSDVYARERQTRPTERVERGDSSRDKPVDEKSEAKAAEASGDEKPAVAESGNALPAASESDEVPEAELDPLLMLGLGGQSVAPSEIQPIGEVQPETLLSGLPAVQGLVSDDGEIAEPTMTSTGLVSDEPVGMQKAAAQLHDPLAQAQLKADNDDGFANALLAGSESLEDAETEPRLTAEELLETIDAPKESRASSLGESAAARVNPLSQAIAQQIQQAQRPALVPGQPVQVQQSGWSEAVVDRVMWMSSQNLKSAEIQLDPAELGRMEVRIEMTKDQAQVTFLSPHAGVRDALEGQMQRLREMFNQQGMSLMDVNVSDQSLARGWQGGADGGSSRGGSSGASDMAIEDDQQSGISEISSTRTGGDRGLVDYYA